MPAAPDKVLRLVETFARNQDEYLDANFNEANLRQQFINPLFKALGWDMDNEQGYAEAYKDVIHEASLKIGGETKAPDYCFRIGGTPKFYLEAKKPAVNIKNDPAPAFQLRRYGWSKKLPLSILTDFEEFAVYDCRYRPSQGDKPSDARIMYLRYTDYAKKWDDIADIFAREAILKGSFDKYAVSAKGKRGTATVDAAFLEEIEQWRFELAKNLALRNRQLGPRELNYAVQITIDRIIFLRMCEDRGVEPYGQLRALIDHSSVYGELCKLFDKADQRYNSGLFHFSNEPDRAEAPDDWTPKLHIDDRTLKVILKSLYYPDSPYEFSVLPAEILGQVYEQFLGKVIRLTSDHHAKVEEKPEVKKAGGVYYTPTYIVDYIVKHTVGKLLGDIQEGEGRQGEAPAEPEPSTGTAPLQRTGSAGASPSRSHLTPKQAAKLRILDPACGSGSFLLGAYNYLLKWYRDAYVAAGPDKHKKELFQAASGDWKLTTAERKRILVNNLYGVDIDPQAVEVTKLSLLLKVLEGESQETLNQQLLLFHERALPDLSSNIKCGNSLIGPDFYEGQQLTLFDEEEKYRINVFDWHAAFPEIMKAGGFDAVIGNPPYIGFHGFAEQKEYLRRRYLSAHGKFDIYLPFVERGLALARDGGLLGYICPTNFMKRDHGRELREHLKDKTSILEIVDFQDVQVFKGATNYTGIFLIEKSRPRAGHTIKYKTRELGNGLIDFNQNALSAEPWVFRESHTDALVKSIRNAQVAPLGEMAMGITEGIVTGQNEVFLLPKARADELRLETEILRPCIRGRQIRRYFNSEVDEVVIYPYRQDNGRTVALEEREIRTFTHTWAYLLSRKPDLAGRGYFERSSKNWYELWCQRDIQLLSSSKIVVPELAESNRFSLAPEGCFYGDTVCGIVLTPETREDVNYVLGLLNSRLIELYYKATTVPKANAFYIYKTMFLKTVPIRRIDFSNPNERQMHDRISELVGQMMGAHNRMVATSAPHDRSVCERHIRALDRQIEELVCMIYGVDIGAVSTLNVEAR